MDSVDLLICGLQARRPEERRRAVVKLGAVAADEPKAVHALLNALADADGEVRHHAGEGLRSAGPAAGKVMPMLIKAFGTGERHVRIVAAHAFKKIGPAAVKAVPALVVHCTSTDG